MKRNFNNFSSYCKCLANILAKLAPFRVSMTDFQRELYDSCCVEYFALIPPVIFTDVERFNDLFEIYMNFIKRSDTV